MAFMMNTKSTKTEHANAKTIKPSQRTHNHTIAKPLKLSMNKSSRPLYIPPHLRTKHTQKSLQTNNNKQQNTFQQNPYTKQQNPYTKHQNTNIKNNNNITFKWYTNEQEFESKLGVSLKSFKLNLRTYRNNKQLNELTNINTATMNISKPKILYVFGPPAVGKSTLYSKYLSEFGIKNAVNTDGDMVRKTHYGIQKYLQRSNALNIGYHGFFRKYCQHWSANWKYEIRQKAMTQRQNIIAFSTCHRFNECISEINSFYENGYYVKILMICAEFEKCNEMGLLRERLNGRKHLNAAYIKSIQGSINVIDYLLRNNKMNVKTDLIVVENKYKMNEECERFKSEWKNIKNGILIPMKKRGVRMMYKDTI